MLNTQLDMPSHEFVHVIEQDVEVNYNPNSFGGTFKRPPPRVPEMHEVMTVCATIKLTWIGAKERMIDTIKAVRRFDTSLGLREAKMLVADGEELVGMFSSFNRLVTYVEELNTDIADTIGSGKAYVYIDGACLRPVTVTVTRITQY